MRGAHAGKRGAGRPGDFVLRHGGPPVATRSHLHRSTLMGLDRLHAARRGRGRGGASGTQDRVADRRRRRATDRAGVRHLLPRRAIPVIVVVNNDGYTVERAIHGEDGPLQRHRRLELDRHPRSAWGGQSSGIPGAELWRARRRAPPRPHSIRTAWCWVEVVLPRLEIPPCWPNSSGPLSPPDGSAARHATPSARVRSRSRTR